MCKYGFSYTEKQYPVTILKNTYTPKTMGGWSLSITWILLIAISAFIYFFDWTVLLYVIVLFVFITLVTMVYDIVTGKLFIIMK